MIKYTTFDKLNIGDYFKFRLDDSEPRIFQKLVIVDPNGFTCALDIKTFKAYKPYAFDSNAEVYRVDKEGEPLDMFKKVPFTFETFNTNLLGSTIRYNRPDGGFYKIVAYGKDHVVLKSMISSTLFQIPFSVLRDYKSDEPLYTLE